MSQCALSQFSDYILRFADTDDETTASLFKIRSEIAHGLENKLGTPSTAFETAKFRPRVGSVDA